MFVLVNFVKGISLKTMGGGVYFKVGFELQLRKGTCRLEDADGYFFLKGTLYIHLIFIYH